MDGGRLYGDANGDVMVRGLKMNERITSDPAVCGGEPVVRGTRIPVHVVLSHLAAGESEASLLENFPRLTHEDVLACLDYAAYLATEKVTPL